MGGGYDLTNTITRFPTLTADIKNLYSHLGIPIQKQTYVFEDFEKLLKTSKLPGEFAITSSDKDLIDLYCLYRSWISFSEGLNRIWTTVEMHKQISDNGLKCNNFGIWFSNSSTIPNLHYANIAFLVSYLTALGVVPVRKGIDDLFLIRQKSSFCGYKKGDYVRQLLGKASKGNWHENIILVTKKIASETGSSLPLDNVDCVRKARNYLDYALLASSTLFSQIGERYYGKCLSVSADLASAVFRVLSSELGIKSENASEGRFDQLLPVCRELIKKYKNSNRNKTLEREVPCLANLP